MRDARQKNRKTHRRMRKGRVKAADGDSIGIQWHENAAMERAGEDCDAG
jgi:uncharacterized membrane protein